MIVLVMDPDRQSRRHTSAALRFAGYEVETARSPAQTASLLRRRRASAVVLDPAEGDAVGTVTSLRAQTDVPLVVVSRSAQEVDKVALLDAGADDYLTKPVGIEELLARLRVLFRRTPHDEGREPPIVTPDFTIHLKDRRWVGADGSEVRLTPTEWRLVELLVQRAGHLVSQSELLRGVWGPDAETKSHYLRVHMVSIRRKVEPDPARPRYFVTASGLGLRFDPHPDALLQSG
jgi:two-component system KDP operon response regulator KdpE